VNAATVLPATGGRPSERVSLDTLAIGVGSAAIPAPADDLALRFVELRPHLVRVAYGMLGSVSEAEDVVQDAWLRVGAADASEVRHLRAWLTTVVARLALDALDRARVRRADYVGPWLPEPIVEELEPADRAIVDETVSMALMVVLERLSPAERSAFVLHDIFDIPFEEVAKIIGRSPAAVRQLAARARRHIADGRPRFAASPDEQLAVVVAFAAACIQGDLGELLALLDPEVIWRSDGGGRAHAARRPHRGRVKVATAMLRLARHGSSGGRLARVNGAPGLVFTSADGVLTVMSFTLDGRAITAVDVIRNPDKLAHVEP